MIYYKSLAYASVLMLVLKYSVSSAQSIEGKVIGVIDGDTIRILDSSKRQIKVRLAGIDAPEKDQAYGNTSKEALSNLIYKKIVSVEWGNEKYSYDRIVGKVMLLGKDINLTQVEQGMAWYYRRFADEQPEEDRISYYEAESQAKHQMRGLWEEHSPVPPWQWRSEQRDAVKRTQDAFHDQWRNRNRQFR